MVDQPELSATGRVILGMIAVGKQTGYDIKQLVDKSTRHFWAASYGQIYPELKRLEERGLIRGRSEPSGGRARTVYELTEYGRELEEVVLRLLAKSPEGRYANAGELRRALERAADAAESDRGAETAPDVNPMEGLA